MLYYNLYIVYARGGGQNLASEPQTLRVCCSPEAGADSGAPSKNPLWLSPYNTCGGYRVPLAWSLSEAGYNVPARPPFASTLVRAVALGGGGGALAAKRGGLCFAGAETQPRHSEGHWDILVHYQVRLRLFAKDICWPSVF